MFQQVPRDHALHHLQHRRDQFGLRGQLANRSGMGSESTHWRTGTGADDVIHQVRRRLRHAPGTA